MNLKIGGDMKLDWLGFTYRNESLLPHQDIFFDGFLNDFPEFNDILDTMVILEKPKLNYEFALSFNENILIMYDSISKKSKGLNVQIPSHALSFFMDLFQCSSVKLFFRLLTLRGCKPSRIDIAFDDYSKTFRPMQYMEWWIGASLDRPVQFRSRFNKANLIKHKKTGDTFYLGTRGKDRFMRIYDKDFESDGLIDSVRYEFEFHQRGAQAIWNEILDTNSLNFCSLLSSFFEIVDRKDSKDGTKTRWSLYEDWEIWLKSQLYFIVDVPKYTKSSNVIKSFEWIEKSCMPLLKVYISVYGEEYFHKVLKNIRLGSKHQRLFIDGKKLVI